MSSILTTRNYQMQELEYLEEERKKLWADVEEIKAQIREIKNTTPEDLAIAKQNSKDTSMYKNRACKSAEEAEAYKNTIVSYLENFESKNTQLTNLINKINNDYSNVEEKISTIEEKYCNIENTDEEFSQKILNIKKSFENCENFLERTVEIKSELEEMQQRLAGYETKVQTLHKRTIEKYGEMKDLYDEIFGYETEDKETGTIQHINGLKTELDGVYSELKVNFSNLNDEFESLKKEKFDEIDEYISKEDKIFSSLQNRIESLLPGAMSAGLSSAFNAKRRLEIKERKNSDIVFYISIGILLLISLIPFCISAYLFWGKGMKIEDVIMDMPRIVLATLPLYLPALWVAYSSNRKSNLSKRLIEEYTHKEALSKTFEGLSKRIENLDDDETSKELKVKLLYNIVSMCSENPGTLIKGYNKSDHPFMDIIDKSVNLTNAIEKCSNIPGMRGIASALLNSIEPNQERKIEQGLKNQKLLEKDDDE